MNKFTSISKIIEINLPNIFECLGILCNSQSRNQERMLSNCGKMILCLLATDWYLINIGKYTAFE